MILLFSTNQKNTKNYLGNHLLIVYISSPVIQEIKLRTECINLTLPEVDNTTVGIKVATDNEWLPDGHWF